MKTWQKYLSALALGAGMTPVAWAQVPATPAAPAVAGAPVAAPAAAPVTTIWAKLGLSCDQLAKCKEKFCGSPLGQLVNNGLKPTAALTGGILGNCCPGIPTAAELAKPNAEGAAAEVKKDEAEAKKRQAAVRYLGTVDCHWWPDAEKGLINALRADKNECVRFEAALALSRGCCCTKEVIKKLTICVNGTEEDGNPSENSERVRMQAQVALIHCLECVPQKADTDNKDKIEKVKPGGNGSPSSAAPAAVGQLAAYYSNDKSRSQSQVIEDARRALEAASNRSAQSAMLPTGSRSLADIWARASAASSGQESMSNSTAVEFTQVPAIAPIPAMSTTPAEKRMETPRAQGEKYTGLIPALMRNKDNAPKEEANWRPGTVTYVTTPAPVTSVASAPAPTPKVTTPAPVTSAVSAPASMPKESSSPAKPKAVTATPAHPAVAGNEWLAVPKLLSVLKESETVAQREWAADCLAAADCTSHPEIIPAVASVAKNDASAIVRIACIRTLDKVKARGPEVITALTALKNDPDPKVQKEAAQAMSHLTGNAAATGIQPVGATTPARQR